MPQLIQFPGKAGYFNITLKIAERYLRVGTILLNDKNGAIVQSIKSQRQRKAESINYDILSRWLQGEGIADRTWRGLLGVLRVHCPDIAQVIEEVMEAEGDSSTDLDEASAMSPAKRKRYGTTDPQAVGRLSIKNIIVTQHVLLIDGYMSI